MAADGVTRRLTIELGVRADQDASRAAKRVADDVIKEKQRADKESGRLSDAEVRRIERFERSMKDAIQSTSRRERTAHEERTKQLREEQRLRERAQRDYARHTTARIDSERAVLEASKKTIQGVLDLSQGLVQLGILGEENSEKMVRAFLQVHSVFQSLRGGIDIITGIAEGMKSLRIATTEAAAAQEALNLAQGQGAVTGTASAGAGLRGAGTAATAAAGTAAVTRGGGLLASLTPAAAFVGTAALATGGGDIVGGQVAPRLAGLTGARQPSWAGPESIIGATWGWWNAAADRDTSQDRSRRIEELRLADAQKTIRNIQEQAQGRQLGLTSGLSQIELAGGALGQSSDAISRQQRAAILAAREQSQGRLDTALTTVQSTNPEVEAAREVTAARELADVQQRLVDLDQRRNQTAQRNLQTRQQAVTLAQQELDRAKQLVETERSRADSNLARFGRLSRGEQNRLRSISERLQSGGELDEQSARFLEATGLGAGRGEEFFRARGEAAGGRDVLAGLGELDGLRDAQREASLAQQRLAVQNERLRDSQERATETNTALIRSIATLDENMARLVQVLQSRQPGANPGEAAPFRGPSGDQTFRALADLAAGQQ